MEHRVASKGKLHAIAHIRIAALQGGKVISMKEVMQSCGFDIAQPPEVEAIKIWKQLLDHKKWSNLKAKK